MVFSHPPIGSVGLSEAAARERHGDAVAVYETAFTDMYYALGERKPKTCAKLVCAGPDERVVGVHIIGRGADEMLQGFAVAVKLGARKRDLDDTVAIAMEFSELGEYFHMPVRTYSSGMRGRLAFGMSMALDFDVYLVDEVTAVGDRRFRQKAQKAFRDRSDHASVIIVSHQDATIRQYCDRCSVLYDGQLHHFDDVDDAVAFYEELG